jgi:hypothetical protein
MNKSQDDASFSLEAPVGWNSDYFSIGDLAVRWRCSRGTVYNMIRGERVLDFAAPGRRGKKLVPASVVNRIEERRTRVFR